MKQIQVLHEASQVVFEHLGQLLGANTFFLAESDLEKNRIVSAWNRSEQTFEEDDTLSYEKSYCKLVLDKDEPVMIPDTAAHPLTQHLGLTAMLGPRSFIGVPVRRRDGRKFGTICALDRPNGFTAPALTYLEQAAVFLGVLVDVEDSLYIDELTSLYNRTYLEMFYDHLSADAELSAVFIDIDRCKAVNEAYGRPFGDALLKRFADRLKHTVRGIGIPARYAGDEFMVLLFHRSAEQAHRIAESIYEQLTAPFDVMGHEIQITVSMGVSMEGTTLSDHIIRSDAAMYQIKKNGKEGIAVYEDELEELIPENGLRRGVKHNAFHVMYQPIVEAATGETVVEALIRLKHPEMGVVGPNAFLPHAEKSGYLLEMDLQTLRNACLQLQSLPGWRSRISKLAVNCDAIELRRPDFPELVAAVLRETSFPADRIEFELNERISMFDIEAIEPQVMRLREMGVTFALDDFGHGYSTLGLLMKLPVQKVKLDRLFVEALPHDPRSRAIVEGLLAMCERLELAVVAEGIETIEQWKALRSLGCRWMQGYLLSRPVPLEELEDALGQAVARCGIPTS
ncbi:putative bifunctional diguanylate cyclase/phosphodiesterase [Paenibacillus antri]|uniref:putative bifunctional diguanylate cyclase/phosphodiesterase n=1 Tax=Paenibacillus antri TaxID=2582848 RepID=UPI0013051094|nr:sensor domain-containing phosphodiesterase [Paenibacillus antri]